MRSLWRRSDEGAIAIVTAIILTVLITLAAFVIDLGLVRSDVRSSQNAADAAVTAAGLELDPTVPNGFQAACQAAWTYFLSNVGGDPTAPDPCANFADSVFFQGGSFTCASRATGGAATQDPTVEAPLYVERVYGEFVFRMQMPVPDADPLMAGQPSNSEFDGDDPCERIGLTIRRNRDNLLGGVIGFPNSASTIDAVSRRVRGADAKEYATLIVLEPEGCLVIDSGGGSGVIVFNAQTAGTPPETTPGVITADTNGASCGGGASDKNFRTGGGGYICGGISPVGVSESAAATAIDGAGSCDTSVTDVLEQTLRSHTADASKHTVGTAGSIGPTPVTYVGKRVTRQLVDHAFNCQSSYGTFSSAPQYYVQDDGNEPAVGPCNERDLASVDKLVGAFITGPVAHRGAGGAPSNGFVEADCSTPAISASRVIINCQKDLQLDVTNAEFVIVEKFSGGGGGGISMTGGDRLSVTPPAGQDAVMVVPEDGIEITGGTFSLTRTFGYLHAGSGVKSGMRVTSSDPFTWTAPENPGWDDATQPHTRVGCGTEDLGGQTAPKPACFEDLAMWSNSIANHSLAGQSNINAEGIFFAPNAGRSSPNSGYFTLSGGNVGAGLDLTDAQFFTWRLNTSGQNPVLMRPNPDRFLATPTFGVGLIR